MKYKEEISKAIEKAEQLALTLETVVNNSRLSSPAEVKRLTGQLRAQLKFISDRISLEYEG